VEKAMAMAVAEELNISNRPLVQNNQSLFKLINKKLISKFISPPPLSSSQNGDVVAKPLVHISLSAGSSFSSPSTLQSSTTGPENNAYFIPENAIDDLDAFAIVSQEEIDKTNIHH
jgi:hypothetical protein